MGSTFLKFYGPDVTGESVDEKHPGFVEILSYSYGVSNTAYTHTGMGGSGGEATFSELSFAKLLDKSTATLLLKAADGTHFERAEIIVYKAGGPDRVPYLKLEFKKVYITSYQMSGSDGGGVAMESISCSYAEVNQTYTEQTDEGGAGPETRFGWNVAKKIAT